MRRAFMYGSSGINFACRLAFALALPGSAAALAQGPAPRIEARPTIRPALDNEKERNNLSGAACTAAGACLLIGDEKRYARFFTIAGGTLAPTPERVFLLPDGADETDVEGIAFAGDRFYLAGSHSRTKTGEAQASRHALYRFRVDSRTGRPADLGTTDTPSTAIERVTLDPFIAAHPFLSQYLMDAPGEGAHGVNIEGIAVADGAAYIGFRGPVGADGALILRLDVDDLFANRAQTPASYRIDLGPGQGVRDLAAVEGGFLILSGPEMRADAPRPGLFFWRPGAPPVSLGRWPVARPGDGPEAITLLEETRTAYRLLVLADGELGGDPMILRVAKPAP